MNRNLLVISVTTAVLAAGATSATTMHKKHMMNEDGRYAAPSQPIPYAQLDFYIKGSPSEREKIVSQSGTQDPQVAQAGVTSPPMSSENAAPNDTTPNTAAAPTGQAATPPMNGPADPAASPNTPQTTPNTPQ